MGVFHFFLNCTNGTKSRKASDIFFKDFQITIYQSSFSHNVVTVYFEQDTEIVYREV